MEEFDIKESLNSLKQPGTILTKLHGLFFDGGNFTFCILHQARITAFAMR
jgi:hypothetical protein